MKQFLLIVLPLLLIVGCSSPEPINYKETLNERDGVFYTKDTNKPYSGSIFSLDYKGRNKIEGVLENGKLITHKEFKWYKNGQKKWEVTFKDGNENELRTYFGNDGKEYKGIFVGGKNIDSFETMRDNGTLNGSIFFLEDNGLTLSNFKNGDQVGLILWYENGQMKYEEIIKDGDGLITTWYENGQKEFEGTYKDGKGDGLQKQWYENGQKSGEGTFKDGKLISSTIWNEDGSVKE